MTARLLVGDVRDVLASLPERSVHCCVTSPPYFGLRSYLSNGHTDKHREIGLESSLDEYITTLVAVFREVKRVLRDDGTCWLNLGDSYAGGGGYYPDSPSNQNGSMQSKSRGSIKGLRVMGGLKPKDLMMVPARVALALQADGWYLRADVIWAKRAPMPESVTDRPTSAHEHVFLLTKQPRYFYDGDAVREPYNPESLSRYNSPLQSIAPGSRQPGGDFEKEKGEPTLFGPNPLGRNIRNVWHLGPEPFPAAHFATFVTEIPRRAILAGTSEKGCCGAMVKKLRLRADLTDEQREMVYARLGSRGVA